MSKWLMAALFIVLAVMLHFDKIDRDKEQLALVLLMLSYGFSSILFAIERRVA